MTTMRVTQNMQFRQSISGVQTSASRVAELQEKLSSGRRINRVSDDPADAAQAMRLRSSLSSVEQYARNADDGMARLGLVDSTLATVTTLVTNARDVALQGANSATASQTSRNALATNIDGLRAALLDQANAAYLTRPVFGGTTAGATAYSPSGTFTGDGAAITRRVGDDVRVAIDVDGRDVFGDGPTSVFAALDDLATALRAGDDAGVRAGIDAMTSRMAAVVDARTTAGTSAQRLENAQSVLEDRRLSLKTSLSTVENIDLPSTLIELNLSQVGYQTALSAAAKVMQPSLIDFLR